MIHKVTLTLALILAGSNQLFGQDTLYVKTASNIIDGSFIEPYTNKWQVSEIDASGSKSVVRVWTDYVQVLELDGVIYLHRIQDLYSPNLEFQESWINIVAKENLLPKRFSLHNTTGRLLNINFNIDKLAVQDNSNQQSFEPEIINLPEVVYDWNLYGMLLVGLPFHAGDIYKIPFWSQSQRSVDHVVATINGKKTIKTLFNKSILARKISTNKGLTFWLIKEKPYIIQIELQQPNGSILLWEML